MVFQKAEAEGNFSLCLIGQRLVKAHRTTNGSFATAEVSVVKSTLHRGELGTVRRGHFINASRGAYS